MKQFLENMINWINTWDFKAILYSLIGTAIFTVISAILKWLGMFRWFYRRHMLIKGIRSYRKSLYAICSSLLVIGPRHGFSIKDVFVMLDLGPSDLLAPSEKPVTSPRRSYVLVGGPGSGKTTMAKKMILDHLSGEIGSPQFLVRLREYDSSESIENHIVNQVRAHKIPNPEVFVRNQLKSPRCLCVLDGLDEVRPTLRRRVCDNVNLFYKRFFSSDESGVLVITCRKEAYRSIPLDLPSIWEVRPLTDEQIKQFAAKWPLGYPSGKSANSFWEDLVSVPRILELARSPLLLVGGLMQYTESNLGIPEERVEYLARIGKWLVNDWAVVQGFPPDPFKAVYPKILSNLAFELHNSQRTEYSFDEAVKFFEAWLPNYGYNPGDAKALLGRIMTKTGILVRDTPGTVIFAQFGLQEYYASMVAIHRLGTKDFARISPKSWWREVILLAIAQEKEPARYLDELFLDDPLLASLAVAECVTPPITLQEKGITACINGINQNNEAAHSSALLLLRRVKGEQEDLLISKLEEQLTARSEVCSVVGLILARAGTSAATAALARHPAIWETCLRAAGFLSSSFEKVLVGLIKNGDDQQSEHAANLLVTRLSADQFEELMGLLPTLSASKAERLAILLLNQIEGDEYTGGLRSPFYSGLLLRNVSRCIPYVRDRERYLKQRAKTLGKLGKVGNIIATSLFLTKGHKSLNVRQILVHLYGAVDWSMKKGCRLCFIASGLAVISFFCNVKICFLLLGLSLTIFVHALISPFSPFLCYIRATIRLHKLAVIASVLAGSEFLCLTIGGRFTPLEGASLALSVSYTLTGLVICENIKITEGYALETSQPPVRLLDRDDLFYAWFAILGVWIWLYLFFEEAIRLWIGAGAFVFTIWLIFDSVATYVKWGRVQTAKLRMELILSNMEEK